LFSRPVDADVLPDPEPAYGQSPFPPRPPQFDPALHGPGLRAVLPDLLSAAPERGGCGLLPELARLVMAYAGPCRVLHRHPAPPPPSGRAPAVGALRLLPAWAVQSCSAGGRKTTRTCHPPSPTRAWAWWRTACRSITGRSSGGTP